MFRKLEQAPPLPPETILAGIQHCSDRLGLDSAVSLEQLYHHVEDIESTEPPSPVAHVKRGLFNFGASDCFLVPFPLPAELESDSQYQVYIRGTKPYYIRLTAVMIRHNGEAGLDSVPYSMCHSVLVHRDPHTLSIKFNLGEHHRCRNCGFEQGLQRTRCKECGTNLPVSTWVIIFKDDKTMRGLIKEMNRRVIGATGVELGLQFQNACPEKLHSIAVETVMEAPLEFRHLGYLTEFLRQFRAVSNTAARLAVKDPSIDLTIRFVQLLDRVISRYGGQVLAMTLQDIDGKMALRTIGLISELDLFRQALSGPKPDPKHVHEIEIEPEPLAPEVEEAIVEEELPVFLQSTPASTLKWLDPARAGKSPTRRVSATVFESSEPSVEWKNYRSRRAAELVQTGPREAERRVLKLRPLSPVSSPRGTTPAQHKGKTIGVWRVMNTSPEARVPKL